MSKAEEKPVSEYGEPWAELGFGFGWVEDANGKEVNLMYERHRLRAIACVNAMQGIPNPEAVREVLKEARFVRAALKLGDLCASDLKRLDEAFESLSAPSTGAQQKGE